MAPRDPHLVNRARALANSQFGAITGPQLSAVGLNRWSQQRLVNSGGWTRLCTGIYLVDAEEPSWVTLASAALLAGRSHSGLAGRSAAYVHGAIRTPPYPIEVHTPTQIRLTIPGVAFFRRANLNDLSRWPRSTLKKFAGLDKRDAFPLPPDPIWEDHSPGVPQIGVQRWNHLRTISMARAVYQVAGQLNEMELIGLLTDAARVGTTPDRIRRISEQEKYLPGRKRVLKYVADVEAGTESPLEFGHDRNLRRHNIPVGRRQSVVARGEKTIRVDREYERFGVRIELDGAFYHAGLKADDDVLRDNDAGAFHGITTLRYRWHHVMAQPCLVARQVAQVLRQRGWRGRPRPCGSACELPASLAG